MKPYVACALVVSAISVGVLWGEVGQRNAKVRISSAPMSNHELALPADKPPSVTVGLAGGVAERPREAVLDVFANAQEGGASERNALISALEASGRSDEAWTQGATSFFDPIPVTSTVDVSSPVCFNAGCYVEVIYEDRSSFREASRILNESENISRWIGGKIETGVDDLGEGGFVNLWILLRPT